MDRRAWLLTPLVLAACGGTQTVYDGPDATTWSPGHVPPITAPAGGMAILTNNGSDTVSLLDLAGGTTLLSVPVGIEPLTNNGPHHLAVDAAARVFFTPLAFPVSTAGAGPHAAHGASASPGVLVKRSLDDFRLLGEAVLEPNPGDVVLSPDGRRIYVSHFDLLRSTMNPGDRAAQLANLLVIDAQTMARVASVPVCIAAHGMTFSRDGRTLYMACYGDDALGVVDVTTTPPSATVVPIGAAVAGGAPVYGPYAIGLSPDGATVWLAADPPSLMQSGGGSVFAFDAATRRFDPSRTVHALGSLPFFPAFSADGAFMFVPVQSRDGLLRVRLGPTPAIDAQMAFRPDQCVLPHQAAMGPDGRLYLVCEGVHSLARSEASHVLALDPTTLAVLATFNVGVYPDDLVFLPRTP